MTIKSNTSKTVKSKRSIQNLLKLQGPMEADGLALQLGISPMAVRQHLYALQDDKLVPYEPKPRPKGRPAKLWKLTVEANKIFPDAHAELTVGLLEVIRDTFGEAGIEKLLDKRASCQIADYQSKLITCVDLYEKLRRFAEIRSDEGYMAAVETNDNGSYIFVENHCPICVAATSCSGLCKMELDVFTAVFETTAEIERTDHIIKGARRCAYEVRPI